ncbi:hypothetical protein JTE90_008057 [Oedothorax gibbosus]|uniref:Cuticle protein n=1 Tax=Oedothorax gibbosus TaxID=931172 RepID=A0AAV6UXE8_9ARAC|nr:hypothetical protein JTE90_008057 [Oedothorax gibbosus]
MISQAFIFAVLIVAVCSHYIPEPIHHASKPYAFGYSVKDHHGEQHREESGTGGHAVKGSYGFTDARGVQRQVEYVADGAGFRAKVKTNEPGTAPQSPAAVDMVSTAHVPYGTGVGYLLTPGAGYGGLGYSGAGYAGAGLGYGGAGLGYGSAGLGYGDAGLVYAGAGLGYAGLGYGGLGYGLGSGLLGGLGYSRYGY